MVLAERPLPLFHIEPIHLVATTILSWLVYRLHRLFRGASIEVVIILRPLGGIHIVHRTRSRCFVETASASSYSHTGSGGSSS